MPWAKPSTAGALKGEEKNLITPTIFFVSKEAELMSTKDNGSDTATTAETGLEEEGDWKEELDALSKGDPELYGFAMHLHLNPMKSISEKIKYFLEGKEVDPLSTEPEIIAQEAERNFRQGKYARAMMGYVCAIDLLFLNAALKTSGKGAEGTRVAYVDRIASYSSRLREIEASASSTHDSGVSWYGLIKQYENIGKRANEALDIVVRLYGKRLKMPVGDAGTQHKA